MPLQKCTVNTHFFIGSNHYRSVIVVVLNTAVSSIFKQQSHCIHLSPAAGTMQSCVSAVRLAVNITAILQTKNQHKVNYSEIQGMQEKKCSRKPSIQYFSNVSGRCEKMMSSKNAFINDLYREYSFLGALAHSAHQVCWFKYLANECMLLKILVSLCNPLTLLG